MFMVARLFSWHYMLADTIGSLLMRHREWWSAGRCFRPCVAPHQTCLSFNVTSAINTHLFVFLSALRYLESTHRPSHNIGTLAYTYTEGPTIPVPSVYTQTAPQWRYFPSTGRSHNTGNVHLRTYGTKILVRPVYTSWSTIPVSAHCRSHVLAPKVIFQTALLFCALFFVLWWFSEECT